MSLTIEQLAELMAGIVRAQQAIIDAAESQEPGFKNTHLLPKLTTASNPRLATARLIDLPSRLLLRSQGRVPMDAAAIARDLTVALGGAAPAATAAPTPQPTAESDTELDFFKS
ncbi:MAG: hypothetical protein JNM76_10665 [Betaproteobacteria bacterium]|nr:hypothetical protein [Betaproteobacteria bacterium]